MTKIASLLDWNQPDRERAPAVERVQYPRDTELRRQYLPYGNHGARINLHLLADLVHRYTGAGMRVLDPMAGIGSLGAMVRWVRGGSLSPVMVELEPSHAADASRNAAHNWMPDYAPLVLRGSADQLPFGTGIFDRIIFSPPYGDTATRRRGEERNTRENNNVPQWRRDRVGQAGFNVDSYGTSARQVGNMDRARYRVFMVAIYRECHRVLRSEGQMVVVTADYFRGHRRQDLCGLTRLLCEGAGFVRADHWERDRSNHVTTWQHVRRQQGLPVVEEEDVQVFRRGGRA